MARTKTIFELEQVAQHVEAQVAQLEREINEMKARLVWAGSTTPDGHWHQLSNRECAAVLCGLRCLQSFFLTTHTFDLKDLANILTDGWTLSPMTSEEVDLLCEKLNLGPA